MRFQRAPVYVVLLGGFRLPPLTSCAGWNKRQAAGAERNEVRPEPMVRGLSAGGGSHERTRLGSRPDSGPFRSRSDEFLESIKKGVGTAAKNSSRSLIILPPLFCNQH